MRLITLFLLLNCILSQLIFSQQNKIDSLNQVLKSTKEDSNKVNILNRICYLYLFSPLIDYKKALPIAEQAQNLSEKLSYYKGIAIADRNLGTIYGYYGVYDKAFESFLNEIKISEKLNDSDLIFRSYQELSFVYSLEGDHEKGLQTNFSIAKMAKSSNDSNRIINSYWRLGSTYAAISKESIKKGDSIMANSNYNNAIINDSMALYLSDKRKDIQNVAFFSNVLGYIYDKCNLCEDSKLKIETNYIKSDHFPQAEQNYFKALQI